MLRSACVAALGALLGCSSESPDEIPGAGSCGPAETAMPDGRCEPAGLPSDMPCAPGELPIDGACVPAGVPPERCVDGFVAVDGGCDAVLPECEAGTMAFAGETSCREVAPCAAGRFGDIVVDADTEYVDVSFSGAPNGSATAPWPTIQQAIDAAVPGATIAIAAGSYAEHLVVTGKAVKLWGVCPRDVEIVGPAEGVAAIDIINGPDGAEVHTLAVRGARVGIGVSNALDVVLDRVWVHDTGDQGLIVDRVLGPASASVHDSLVESVGLMGLIVLGGTVDIARTVVRDAFGRGVDVLASPYDNTPSDISLADVVVERAHGGGIVVAGSLAEVTRAVVHDIDPDEFQARGWGIAFFDVPGFPPTNATLRDSVVERSHDVGVIASASAALVEGVSIRESSPSPTANGGPGLMVEAWLQTSLVATATVRQSLVEHANTLGVYVGGARGVVLEGMLVRDTDLHATGNSGWGISIQDEPDVPQAASATMRYSVIERTHDSGIFVVGSEVAIEATAVRDTSSAAARFGSALTVLDNLMTRLRSDVTVHASLFERSMEAGAVVAGSDLAITQSLIRQTAPNTAGTHGDGILVVSYAQVGHLELLRSRVEHSQRAAVACFGGTAEIGSSVLACHSFAMDSERFANHSCTLSDLGGNLCGCEALESSCKAVSASLEPPGPVSEPYDPNH